jgi:hypothetical protein
VQKVVADGERRLYEHVRGYCLSTGGFEVPALEAMLEPNFEWPDILFRLSGSRHFKLLFPNSLT